MDHAQLRGASDCRTAKRRGTGVLRTQDSVRRGVIDAYLNRGDSMKLLVAGDARVDAGKTTFAAGLLASLSDVVGFKPRAGNDYWFDHDDVATALAEGRLYGKDIATLTATGDAVDR